MTDTKSQYFPACAVQMVVGSDKEENLVRARHLVRKAARRGARLVALPELFNWGGRGGEEWEASETVPGPTTAALSSMARELDVILVGGSLLERVGGESKVYNTSCVFDPSGEIVATYRKIHLFDIELAGRVAVRESDTRLAGEAHVVVESGGVRIGLALCYDLRFPELFRALVDDGAEIVCLPSAFTFATGSVHWDVLLRARAIENQVYVVAPDQCGRGASGILNFGNSMIVDPWGAVLARAAEGDGLAMADIDLAYLKKVRQNLPCLDHRTLRV